MAILVALLPVALGVGWVIAALEAAEGDRAEAEGARRTLETAARTAQEQALKAQLDPHVLYNALGGISELVREDPGRAEAAILSLAELYRKLTALGRRETVTLGEERALLEDYLSMGACGDGGVAATPRVTERPFASFDLGLALFRLGERYGKKFGEEEANEKKGEPNQADQRLGELRSAEVECALRVVLAIAGEPSAEVELRARAHYLAGNLEFLRSAYEEAVRHYDEALKLVPGMVDGGDTLGQDAAFNRAIALERIEDKKRDAGQDASPPDAGPGDASDNRGDGATDKKEAGPDNRDAGKNRDDKDAAAPPPEPPDAGDKHEPPPPQPNQDDRILDMLESAPTFQKQDAKNHAQVRRGRGMMDK